MRERRRTSVSETTATATPSETAPGTVETVSTTTTTTTEADPVLVASGLAEAFAENTKALHKVQGRTRTISVLLVLVMLALVGLGGTVYAIRQIQLTNCRATNDVRSGSLHIADTLEAALLEPRPDGRERTPQEIAATQAFVADLRDDFALREC